MPQDYSELLDDNANIISFLLDNANKDEVIIRNTLGQALFRTDEPFY